MKLLDPFQLFAGVVVETYMASRLLVNFLFTVAVIIAIPATIWNIPHYIAEENRRIEEHKWMEIGNVNNLPGTQADRDRWNKEWNAAPLPKYSLPVFMVKRWEAETGKKWDNQYRGGTLEAHSKWYFEHTGKVFVPTPDGPGPTRDVFHDYSKGP